MAWVERKKIIKKRFLLNKTTTFFEEVNVVGIRKWHDDRTTSGIEYLVENENKEKFVVTKIYI
jgi:hypothetical protein